MLKQDKQAKMDKFNKTMPTIIQIHLIIAPNWEEVTKKAKNLEHIIRLLTHPFHKVQEQFPAYILI